MKKKIEIGTIGILRSPGCALGRVVEVDKLIMSTKNGEYSLGVESIVRRSKSPIQLFRYKGQPDLMSDLPVKWLKTKPADINHYLMQDQLCIIVNLNDNPKKFLKMLRAAGITRTKDTIHHYYTTAEEKRFVEVHGLSI